MPDDFLHEIDSDAHATLVGRPLKIVQKVVGFARG